MSEFKTKAFMNVCEDFITCVMVSYLVYAFIIWQFIILTVTMYIILTGVRKANNDKVVL